MVTIMSLWLPILLSAVFVFVASSIIHMVLKYHSSEYKPLPNEDSVLNALRPFNIPQGFYTFPHCAPGAWNDPAYQEKVKRGPVGFINVMPNAMPNMGKSLGTWFAYCLLVGVFAAYIAGRTLEPGTAYLAVFQITGAVAFAGYALALLHESIWFNRAWSATAKFMFDGLIYAGLTGGTFGWLWPNA